MKKIVLIFLVCLSSLSVLVAGAPTANSQIYKWVDAEGRVHYSATPTDEAQDVDEELPPAAHFIAPARPPSSSSEAPASEDEQPPQEASADSPAQSSEAPTNDQSSLPSQQQQEQPQEEIGIGEYGPFGSDGPGGPTPNPE